MYHILPRKSNEKEQLNTVLGIRYVHAVNTSEPCSSDSAIPGAEDKQRTRGMKSLLRGPAMPAEEVLTAPRWALNWVGPTWQVSRSANGQACTRTLPATASSHRRAHPLTPSQLLHTSSCDPPYKSRPRKQSRATFRSHAET